MSCLLINTKAFILNTYKTDTFWGNIKFEVSHSLQNAKAFGVLILIFIHSKTFFVSESIYFPVSKMKDRIEKPKTIFLIVAFVSDCSNSLELVSWLL